MSTDVRKPTEFEYIMKLIPNTAIFDEIERYAILNNNSGVFSFSGADSKLLFYSDSENKINMDTGFKRAIFKVYGESTHSIKKSEIIKFISFETTHNNAYVNKNHLLVICDENLSEIKFVDNIIDSSTAVYDAPYYYIIVWCENDVTIKFVYPDNVVFDATIIGVCF